MKLGGFMSEALLRATFENQLVKGAVFGNKFPEIDHEKYFVVVGLSETKVFTCSFYINSGIHHSIVQNQELLNLQVPIRKEDHDFYIMIHLSAVLPHCILKDRKSTTGSVLTPADIWAS